MRQRSGCKAGERLKRQRVLRLESVDDAACQELLKRFAQARVAVRVWDTTSDVGVASFYCLVMGEDDGFVDPEFGSGCHPARQVALLRALTEAAQARTTYIAGSRDDFSRSDYSETARSRRYERCRMLMDTGGEERHFHEVPSSESETHSRGRGLDLGPPSVSGHPAGVSRGFDKTGVRDSRRTCGSSRPGRAGHGRSRRLRPGTSCTRGSG